MEPEHGIITMHYMLSTIPIIATGYVSVPVNTCDRTHYKMRFFTFSFAKLQKIRYLQKYSRIKIVVLMFFIDLEQFCLSRKREERIGKSD